MTVRALLDQGSEATFISEHLAQSLYAKRLRMPISISAVGGTRVGKVHHASSIIISPRDSDNPSLCTTAYILNSLTAYASRRVTISSHFAHLSNLSWADADPSSSDPIDILIGADIYCDVIQEGVRKGNAGQLIAQQTIFGWVISGPVAMSSDLSRASRASTVEQSSANITVLHCTNLQPLSEEIQRFWEVEEIPPPHQLAPLDEQCETHFCDTHSRQPDGRYIVRLPFKRSPINIGRSRLTAERLFNSISRRLNADATLSNDYNDFMREYIILEHMRKAPPADRTNHQCVYIPHHPVIRKDSVTTRLRVVFNASCATSNGTSLNDHLLTGPKLQKDLPAIVLLWCHFKFVYTADITKMYRQILIDPRDLDYQRILWKGDPSEGPIDYQLLTVTYGMNCAPFLALRVIKCLTDDDGHMFPRAVPILRHQTYVDDVLFGGDNIDSVQESREQLVALLRRRKFELRKWASNSPKLLADIDPSERGLSHSKPIGIDDKIKVLGIAWNPTRDAFQIKISTEDLIPRTKRTILSTVAKLYDPLGWVTPVIVASKIFMQQLWRGRIGWDEQIPDDLFHNWSRLYTRLSHLNNLHLSRWTGITAETSQVELHDFADASTLAYAGAVYLKVTSATGQITISLLAGKSKIAPISSLTVPRLELSAALLLTRLTNFVQRSLPIEPVSVTCWTDSTIVLAWIRSHPSRWKVFVANRVHEIQSGLPDAEWRHVPTLENPADCASRGLCGDELLAHSLWQGPSWLAKARGEWPEEPLPKPVDFQVEAKIIVSHISQSRAPWDLSSRYASWPTLIRVTAYIIRFVDACRRRRGDNQSIKLLGRALSSAECSLAKTFWIKRIQSELFSNEINRLTNHQNVASKSSIAGLRPFLDQDCVMRVGGRLRLAPIPFRMRHPILLSSHPLVRLIISQAHLRVLHGGTQLTMSTLRQDYWIIRARSLVRSVIHGCLICARERAAVPTQLMGDLPSMRVSPSPRSFAQCGVDYAGPI
ncbi:uncharacterized protein LOC118645797 [Monomorium pharaonis]|uniref:uncharacterized protein LOC118645797 n=1 Tax=Monomorium pharaonis TaxID=307658 RepID=UPI001746891F|nr:uncharacterized protein LOC118645797 [Monomorium pharaonis]